MPSIPSLPLEIHGNIRTEKAICEAVLWTHKKTKGSNNCSEMGNGKLHLALAGRHYHFLHPTSLTGCVYLDDSPLH